jgi:hypothetical protein
MLCTAISTSLPDMKFRRKPKFDNGINLTPLIDVVFLLLIFFMVTTTFTKHTSLVINLPEASGEPAPEQVEPLDLLVSREGNYSLNGQNLINYDHYGGVKGCVGRGCQQAIEHYCRCQCDPPVGHYCHGCGEPFRF